MGKETGMTTPEFELKTLLGNLSPRLNAGEFVFLTIKERLPAHVHPLATFHEWEGESVLLRKEQAETIGLKHGADTYAWITLAIQTPLESVGLTAAVSAALAAEGIPCNVVAAFHHDHIFIPTPSAKKAMEILRNIEKQA
jgi:hypothetical protein